MLISNTHTMDDNGQESHEGQQDLVHQDHSPRPRKCLRLCHIDEKKIVFPFGSILLTHAIFFYHYNNNKNYNTKKKRRKNQSLIRERKEFKLTGTKYKKTFTKYHFLDCWSIVKTQCRNLLAFKLVIREQQFTLDRKLPLFFVSSRD